jgi:lipopolysaccharide export system permease protein
VIPRTLDRYILRLWLKIFTITTIGFPLVVILIELTDKLDEYLLRDLDAGAIALAYVFSVPETIFMVLPAAVLFATVFSIGSLNRHSELTAAKASGRSFYRMLVPILIASLFVTGLSAVVGEMAPNATRRKLELLGELEIRSQNSRQNFVYRASEGWVYSIRSLNVGQRRLVDIVLEREGAGVSYPTLIVQARFGVYDDTTSSWTLGDGRFRILSETKGEDAFLFDSLRLRSLAETPADLLLEPKRPQEMTYSELGSYIEALERSGGDGRRLTVEQALKIAIPVTCLIITLFAAPLVVAAPRASGAVGVAVGLGTTLVFLLSVQLSQAVGAGGLLPPVVAAWTPNVLFCTAGFWFLKRART